MKFLVGAVVPAGIQATFMVPAILIAVAVILLIIIIATSYVKAPPNKAYIITGLKKKPKILIGKAGLKLPFLERKDELLIEQLSIDIKTGEEYSLDTLIATSKELGVKMSEVVEFDNFNDMMKVVSEYPKELEGVVVTFDNGYKCKLKGIEYCEMFKVMNNLTEREMYMRYNPVTDIFYANVDPTKGYRNIDDEVLEIPEELPEIRNYADNLRERMHNIFNIVYDYAVDFLKTGLTGKERYDYVKIKLDEYPQYLGLVLSTMKDIEKGDTKYASVKVGIKKLLR